MSESGFTVEREDQGGEEVALRLHGSLQFAHAEELWDRLRDEKLSKGCSVRIDFSAVDQVDSGSMALIVALRDQWTKAGHTVELGGARGSVRSVLELYESSGGNATMHDPPRRRGLFDHVGAATQSFFRALRDVLSFIGELSLSSVRAVRRPSSVDWRQVAPLAERAGADGLPITCLITFLVGLIMGFQAAMQLRQYGADIFVADLVGLSVTRELGPLMTAIIVASRSGAAFAAELGTMKVSEEVDALRTVGLDPLRFLVMPRVFALLIALPLLTLIADLMGVFGGMVVGFTTLDLTMRSYLMQTQSALSLIDVFSGVLKSLVFGVVISVVACQRGLATRGGAAGVGYSTTAAVVTILFALVLLDAVFAVVFQVLGV